MDLLPYFRFLIVFTILLFGISKFYRFSKPLKIVVWILGFISTLELLSLPFINSFGISISSYHYIYTPIIILLIIFLYSSILKNKVAPNVIYLTVAIYVIMLIINTIFPKNIENHITISMVVGGVLVLILSILYFTTTLKEAKISKLEQSPVFWINAGIFLYICGYILILVLFRKITTNTQFSVVFPKLHHFLALLLYSLVFTGIITINKSS